jgi:hypothetical protein
MASILQYGTFEEKRFKIGYVLYVMLAKSQSC